MAAEITWLHISDLHIDNPTENFRLRNTLTTLLADLRTMQQQYGLRPDIVFFTGDAVSGKKPGLPQLDEQYDSAKKVFDEICSTFVPVIDKTSFFIVPGNHDVNRDKRSPIVYSGIQAILNASGGHPQDVLADWFKRSHDDQKDMMRSLEDYGNFLQSAGYSYLFPNELDRARLIFAKVLRIRGINIGVVGLNSAWYSGRDQEKGQLVMGGEWQIDHLWPDISEANVRICLMHHPASWFSEYEAPQLQSALERFDFVLHGHEHDYGGTVHDGQYVRLSAGACNANSDVELGYSFVRYNVAERTCRVWMRDYTKKGEWGPARIARKLDAEGCWHFELRKRTQTSDSFDQVDLHNSQGTLFLAEQAISRANWVEAQQILAVLENLYGNNPDLLVRVRSDLAQVKRQQGLVSEAIDILREIRVPAQQGLLGKVQLQLGIYSRQIGKYGDAIDYIDRSIQIFESCKQELSAAEAYTALGDVHRSLGTETSLNSSIECYKKSIELIEKTSSDLSLDRHYGLRLLAQGYRALGRVLIDQGNSIEGLDYLLEAYRKSKELEDFHGLILDSKLLGQYYKNQHLQDKMLEESGATHFNDETAANPLMIARRWLNESFVVSYLYDDIPLRIDSIVEVAEVEYLDRQFERARKLVQLAQDSTSKTPQLDRLLAKVKLLEGNIYWTKGDIPQAIHAYKGAILDAACAGTATVIEVEGNIQEKCMHSNKNEALGIVRELLKWWLSDEPSVIVAKQEEQKRLDELAGKTDIPKLVLQRLDELYYALTPM